MTKVNEVIKKLMGSSIKLSQEMGRSLPDVIASLQKTEFPQTSRALVGFTSRSGYLCNAILSTCYTNDRYSPKVLMRSLIEHVFIHLYIYTRALKDNDDEVGKKYYSSLKAAEDLNAMRKINNYKKIVFPEKTKWDTGGSHNKKIEDAAKEFEISKIFYYLIGNVGTESEIFQKYQKEYLLHRIEEYTRFSSVIHGGPHAQGQFFTEHAKNTEVLTAVAEDAWMLHRSLVVTTYLFASLMDEKLTGAYDAIVALTPKNGRGT